MANEKITFESATTPGLNIIAGGRSYRFRGGVLVVDSEEADAIRAYATTHSYYQITEGATRKVALNPTVMPANDPLSPTELDQQPSMRMSKADLLAMAQTRGVTADESMTKADIVAALGGDSADLTGDPDATADEATQ